jgi:hypothetical protein
MFSFFSPTDSGAPGLTFSKDLPMPARAVQRKLERAVGIDEEGELKFPKAA